MYYLLLRAAPCEKGGKWGGRPGRGNLGAAKFILPTSFIGLSQEKLGVGGAKFKLCNGRVFSLHAPG